MLVSILILCSSACVDTAPMAPRSLPYVSVADSVSVSDSVTADSIPFDPAVPEVAPVDSAAGTAKASGSFTTGWPAEQRSKTRAFLPRVMLDFPYPAVTGRSIKVDAGDNLQSALNRARRGDEIVLEAGANYTGNYVLPSLSGSAANGWIVIRGERSDRLPALGTRVGPEDGTLMPKITTPNEAPALRLEAGASGWRLVGLEVTVRAGLPQQQYGIIYLGESDPSQSTIASVPTDIVLDRMYIHAHPTTNTSRCVALNSARTQISDSYITECHGRDFDSQAIWGGNGPGPFKIVNNYLAGAGENVMFGGYDPKIPGLVPSDIEIRRNYIHTPLAWRGTWQRKNLLELKNATRVLIEGNVLDGSWADAQTGWAVVIMSANQDGKCRWCRVSDVTFRQNLTKNAGAGINVIGFTTYHPRDSVTSRVVIQESVFQDIGVAPYQGDQRGFQLLGNAHDVTIERVVLTGQLTSALWLDPENPTLRATFRNNVWAHGQYGAIASGFGPGALAIQAGAPFAVWERMTFVGAQGSGYPVGTAFVSDERHAPVALSVRNAVSAATAGVVR